MDVLFKEADVFCASKVTKEAATKGPSIKKDTFMAVVIIGIITPKTVVINTEMEHFVNEEASDSVFFGTMVIREAGTTSYKTRVIFFTVAVEHTGAIKNITAVINTVGDEELLFIVADKTGVASLVERVKHSTVAVTSNLNVLHQGN